MITPQYYVYAGFMYIVHIGLGENNVRLEPAPGQHSAASKEKHIRAARECFIQDNAGDHS